MINEGDDTLNNAFAFPRSRTTAPLVSREMNTDETDETANNVIAPLPMTLVEIEEMAEDGVYFEGDEPDELDAFLDRWSRKECLGGFDLQWRLRYLRDEDQDWDTEYPEYPLRLWAEVFVTRHGEDEVVAVDSIRDEEDRSELPLAVVTTFEQIEQRLDGFMANGGAYPDSLTTGPGGDEQR